MIYFPDTLIEGWLLDDINQGDLTTQALEIGQRPGRIIFTLKNGGRLSGAKVATKILNKLDLRLLNSAEDGNDLIAGGEILSAVGPAGSLHQGWKVCQNILEWSSGVAAYMAGLLDSARKENPGIQVACTRKNIPGTKLLAHEAVLNGGGIIHRGGTAETILLFANHRRFCQEPDNWKKQIDLLKRNAPEKKIVVEADNIKDFREALLAAPDMIQLDKFSPQQVKDALDLAAGLHSPVKISAAGGINKDNAAAYAKTGVELLVTSAPYYAKPVDVKVTLEPF